MSGFFTIVGGGPAGLACAITLRRMGVGVEVIERQDYSKLDDGTTRQYDDLHIVVMNPVSMKVLEDFLRISFIKSSAITAYTCKNSYGLDSAFFHLIRKGYSRDSINYQLFSHARDLGVQFRFANPSLDSLVYQQNIINASGCADRIPDFLLYGFRFTLNSPIPDRSIAIDFTPATEDYFYVASLGDKTSCIFLSRKRIDEAKAREETNVRLRSMAIGAFITHAKPFAFRMPRALSLDNSRYVIGTRRGINDRLFFFGLADSIIDGINLALSTTTTYDRSDLFRGKQNKNRILAFLNALKRGACSVGLKDEYVSSFLRRGFLKRMMIELVRSEISDDMRAELMRFDSTPAHQPTNSPHSYSSPSSDR